MQVAVKVADRELANTVFVNDVFVMAKLADNRSSSLQIEEKACVTMSGSQRDPSRAEMKEIARI